MVLILTYYRVVQVKRGHLSMFITETCQEADNPRSSATSSAFDIYGLSIERPSRNTTRFMSPAMFNDSDCRNLPIRMVKRDA